MTGQIRPARARTQAVERRYGWIAGLVGLMIAALLAHSARAADEKTVSLHGYNFFGELSYPADFKHFNYVNPQAPKGGEVSIARSGTFDSLNPYTRKGVARGTLIWETYESLLGDGPADAYGEQYGLLAESLEYPEDKSWVIFHMRPEARFSDGTPVTAHDVLFSHNLLLDQGLQSYAEAVRKRIPKAEVLDDHTIRFHFADGISRRSLIDQVGGVPVWSKAWYEKTGARLDEPRLDVSPGSGPYVLDDFEVNRRVTYKRNPDYWGKDLPVNVGRHNFDRIRIEYFADTTGAFEAFKAGEVSFRSEPDPKRWASFYDFPAAEKGWVKREEIRDGFPPGMNGIVFNLGSEPLKDKRVRQAVALGYNFDWTNKSLLYGLFAQQESFSDGTHLEAEGVPEGPEREFLESLGDLVPPALFEGEPEITHSGDADRLVHRRSLRQAMKLLDEAGWPVGDDGIRRNAEGKVLQLDFLINASGETTDAAIAESFVSNLRKMGIEAKLEEVDSAQYTKRERDRDYDLVFDGYPALFGAGTGLMQRFGSEAADYSLFNPAGLASPLVDEIINKSLLTETQAEEDMTMRALDRALRHEFFLIPQGYPPDNWVAYWDMYSHPEKMPPFDVGVLDFWWYDADKAEKLKQAGAL